MTTEQSVLEKLKRISEARTEWQSAPLRGLVHKQRYYEGILKMFAYEDLPRLIAMLELVEGKAGTEPTANPDDGYWRGLQRGEIIFARELLAALESKEAKGE